jgi:signal peptidase
MALEVLQSTGKLRLQVTGSSMLPSLWPGDVLTLESISAQPLLPGEIVLFQREDQLVIHRVSRLLSSMGHTEAVTRGDCIADEDAPIAASDVLGRVIEVYRGHNPIPISISIYRRSLGWVLSHSDFLSRVALRFHAIRQSRLGFTPTSSEGAR